MLIVIFFVNFGAIRNLESTVIAQKKKKKIADTGRENICGKYFCGCKMTLLKLKRNASGKGVFYNRKYYYRKYFSLKKTFPCPLAQSAVVFSGPKVGACPGPNKKKKNWDNFLGANLQVCHPKGPFLNLGRPCGIRKNFQLYDNLS
jgi:hypothetical protein